METVIITLHVVAAVFIVGPMAILPTTGLRAIRAGQGGQVTTFAKSVFVTSLVSIVVVVLGFGAMGLADLKYNLPLATPWISILAWTIALVINLALVVPRMSAAGPSSPLAPPSHPRQGAGRRLTTKPAPATREPVRCSPRTGS